MRFLDLIAPRLAWRLRRRSLSRLQTERQRIHANLDWYVLGPGQYPLWGRPTLEPHEAQDRQNKAAPGEDQPWAQMLHTWLSLPSLTVEHLQALADAYVADARARPDDLITSMTREVLMALDDPQTLTDFYVSLARMGHASSLGFFALLLERITECGRHDLIEVAAAIYQPLRKPPRYSHQLPSFSYAPAPTPHMALFQAWAEHQDPASLRFWDYLDDDQRRATLIHVLRQRNAFRGSVVRRMAPGEVFNLVSREPDPFPEAIASWLGRFHAHDRGTSRMGAWAGVMAHAISHHFEHLPYKLLFDSSIKAIEPYLTSAEGPAVVAHLATVMASLSWDRQRWDLLDHWRGQWTGVIAPGVWRDEAVWPAAFQKLMFRFENESHSLPGA